MNQETRIRQLERAFTALERHEQGSRSLDEFLPYAEDPIGFIRDVLKGQPWSMQEHIGELVRDTPLVVVRSCNGAGKDWLAARIALWWVYARQGQVLVTGPTARQVAGVVFGEVRRAFHSAPDLPGELYETELRVDRTRQMGILGFTSTDASKLTGFHAPRLLVILTEAQAVEAYAWEGMTSCATGEHDRFLAVGNPLQPEGMFYQVSRSPTWRAVRISAFDHPNVRERREVIPGGVTQAFIDRIAEAYGRGGGIYASRVEGEFPDNADDALVERPWLDRAAELWQGGHFEHVAAGARLAFACDPARFGRDKTALAVRQGPVLREIVIWKKLGTMQTTGRIIEEARRSGCRLLSERDAVALHERVDSRVRLVPACSPEAFPLLHDATHAVSRRAVRAREDGAGAEELVVDDSGLGGGVVDRLREQGIKVKAFIGGSSPTVHGAERFLNTRAEAFFGLRALLEHERIALPPDRQLFEELLATRFGITSMGKVQIESKDLIKQTIGRSPDRADAVSMSFYSFSLPRKAERPRYASVSYESY